MDISHIVLLTAMLCITLYALYLRDQAKAWKLKHDGLTTVFRVRTDDWSLTEERLIGAIERDRSEYASELARMREANDQLLSTILTMREQGFSGGNPYMLDEPRSYILTDEEELAEYQRRLAETEGSDEELLAQIRSSLSDTMEEFEEPETL